jgi:hypothetical protein
MHPNSMEVLAIINESCAQVRALRLQYQRLLDLLINALGQCHCRIVRRDLRSST